jgi:predicted nucleic acid-binding protein
MCACCFIDLVKQSVSSQIEAGRANEVWFIDQLLRANLDGEIEVYTSTLTVAECTHVGEENITEQVRTLFVRFLTSGQYVTLIEPDVFVAEAARDLRWKHGIALSGIDALHVASALSMECQEFHTTDSKRKGPIGQASKIAALGMMALKPSDTGFLSDERRQVSMLGVLAAPSESIPQTARSKRKKS